MRGSCLSFSSAALNRAPRRQPSPSPLVHERRHPSNARPLPCLTCPEANPRHPVLESLISVLRASVAGLDPGASQGAASADRGADAALDKGYTTVGAAKNAWRIELLNLDNHRRLLKSQSSRQEALCLRANLPQFLNTPICSSLSSLPRVPPERHSAPWSGDRCLKSFRTPTLWRRRLSLRHQAQTLG
jgi:hypothetical protein